MLAEITPARSRTHHDPIRAGAGGGGSGASQRPQPRRRLQGPRPLAEAFARLRDESDAAGGSAMTDVERVELNELCSAAVDGVLTSAQRDRLQRMLRESNE